MRALITGAAGFVGRHLANYLVENGDWELYGVQSEPGPSVPRARMTAGDLLDEGLSSQVIHGCQPDVIFHLAAQADVATALASPARTLVNNAVAQINVLEACRAADLNPVILVVSSAEVYGAAAPADMPLTEQQPFRPTNPYAVSKITQDMLGLQYHLSYGMRIIRVRPFNHIGPGQSDRFVVSSFGRQIAEFEAGLADPVVRVGNLEAQRDFLDVRDVVRAYVAVVTRPESAGEVYNVASGVPRSIRSILDQLASLASVEMRIQEDATRMRPSDVPVLVGDASKLIRHTGWQPQVPIERSLADTLDFWRERVRSSG
jgi:GDP-4-dehydro-6-deoxy-D-mannose reductase